ncbi:NAD-dependent epimerase/dehydratase family protein [Paenibacillus koleovorans]|uniref:NAD-dependent epimerase/dehydratase family protein n=1 Tax=Paenibacillus koleovorans TaxID=121608 RepID=UPI000FD86478|nr:NAD-dependent epimerase/dehydratase family protein [Paenibacillus koleovorans]
MRALITGGAGFIGSHIVERLVQAGVELLVVDNLSSGHALFVPTGVKLVQQSVTSPDLEAVFATFRPDYVFHLAAQIDVAKSMQHPIEDAESNIVGTVNVLQCCHKLGVRKLIFSSSCAVYGDTGDTLIPETCGTRPLSFYGLSKYVSERYILLYHHLYKLPYTILRYANVYGPRQAVKGEGGVISIFLRHLLHGEPLRIYGDGSQTRDFIYAKDVAAANLLCLDKGDNRILNIGSSRATPIHQLAAIVRAFQPESSPLTYGPERPGEIQYSVLDHTEAMHALGWTPQFSLEEGLKETLDFYKGEERGVWKS